MMVFAFHCHHLGDVGDAAGASRRRAAWTMTSIEAQIISGEWSARAAKIRPS